MDRKSENCGRHAARVCIVVVALTVLLTAPLGLATSGSPVQSTAQAQVPGAVAPEISRILTAAARSLGWPTAPALRPDLPGQALGISVHGGPGGALCATLSVVPDADEPTLLQDLENQGMLRGLFHGREAIIVHPGDLLCPAEAAASAGAPSCAPSTRGIIAWRCGPYVLTGEDATGSGREEEIAEALYQAAEKHSLGGIATRGGWRTSGGWSSSVVILAETTDSPGEHPLSYFRDLAQRAEQYYAANAYGRVSFDLTFMDADGPVDQRHPASTHDWYNIGPSLAAYAGDKAKLVEAAIAKAFADADLPPIAYMERVIVVYAEGSQPSDAAVRLVPSTIWASTRHTVEIKGRRQGSIRERLTSLYIPNLILVSEQDDLGIWVHELGHTLHARPEASGHGRIPDRYGYHGQQGGNSAYWDLMGDGCRWGTPQGSSPTHMSSYTKEAAGWLHYAPAQLDTDHDLTALEHQQAGSLVLKLDDPAREPGSAVDAPLSFYLIEARDAAAAFGAPESGVVIHHVTHGQGADGAVAQAEICQNSVELAAIEGRFFQRSTLHGVADPDGASEYIIPGGLRVRLLAESFSPYRATIRIERYSPRSPEVGDRAN